MREFCFRVCADVCFDLSPGSRFVSDTMAACTNWEVPAQNLQSRLCLPEAQEEFFLNKRAKSDACRTKGC